MTKARLDHELAARGLVASRSQAESYIKLGKVFVDGKQITKPGFFVAPTAQIQLQQAEQYVSRAGLKLASVAQALSINFTNAVVLDVGSSTGGFTDFALRNGAKKVYAVDVGTNQLHPSLHGNPAIELHEQTDIRDFVPSQKPTVVVIDVSFISLRAILPHIAAISGKSSQIVAMVKPQFEASAALKNKGVIKNDAVRRDILKDFEQWTKKQFVILDKADSEVAGAKGNRERFYLLTSYIIGTNMSLDTNSPYGPESIESRNSRFEHVFEELQRVVNQKLASPNSDTYRFRNDSNVDGVGQYFELACFIKDSLDDQRVIKLVLHDDDIKDEVAYRIEDSKKGKTNNPEKIYTFSPFADKPSIIFQKRLPGGYSDPVELDDLWDDFSEMTRLLIICREGDVIMPESDEYDDFIEIEPIDDRKPLARLLQLLRIRKN